MPREVKQKCIEIGIGLLLYINALFSVRHWDMTERTKLLLYLLPYLVMSL